MKNSTQVLAAAVMFSVLAPLSSAATIQFTSTLPNTDVILTNSVPTTANIQVRNIGSSGTANRWLGVGFSAASNTSLDQVTFFIDTTNPPTASGNANSLGASMTIAIYSLSSLTSAPAANAAPLYSEVATVPSTYSGQGYVTFNLATPYALTAGSAYGIMISFNNTASSRGMNLLEATSSTGGKNNIGYTFYTYDAGATYTSDAHALNFVLQSPPAAVPEASSVSLLLFSGLGLMATRLPRRKV